MTISSAAERAMCDPIIVGAGPVGLFAARRGLSDPAAERQTD
jgi:thioredoxin reductase